MSWPAAARRLDCRDRGKTVTVEAVRSLAPGVELVLLRTARGKRLVTPARDAKNFARGAHVRITDALTLERSPARGRGR